MNSIAHGPVVLYFSLVETIMACYIKVRRFASLIHNIYFWRSPLLRMLRVRVSLQAISRGIYL